MSLSSQSSRKIKLWLMLVAILATVSLGCMAVTAASTVSPNTEVPIVEITKVPEEITLPTIPPPPTLTPLPTLTPIPTLPPTSTPLPTEPPLPIDFVGSGDSVLDVNKWSGPAILRLSHNGQHNFIVENFDVNNNGLGLLVNEIGNYAGIIPLDFGYFGTNADTKRITVDADGVWEIHVLPLSSAQIVPVPGVVAGEGENVLLLDGATPDTIIFDASQAAHNVVLEAYSHEPSIQYLDLLVNEIGAYTGTLLAPSGATVLVVKADGPWRLEITAR